MYDSSSKQWHLPWVMWTRIPFLMCPPVIFILVKRVVLRLLSWTHYRVSDMHGYLNVGMVTSMLAWLLMLAGIFSCLVRLLPYSSRYNIIKYTFHTTPHQMNNYPFDHFLTVRWDIYILLSPFLCNYIYIYGMWGKNLASINFIAVCIIL